MGRTKNMNFEELQFQMVKSGDNKVKWSAYCYVCKKTLTNTAASRLKAHRAICKIKLRSTETTLTNYGSTIENESNQNLSMTMISDLSSTESSFVMAHKETVIEVVPNPTIDESSTALITIQDNQIFSTYTVLASCPESSLSSASRPSSSASSIPSTSSGFISELPKKRRPNLSTFLDKVSDVDVANINSKLAAFFFGCNIPFNVIESDHFKNFIKSLRPAYSPKLPERKALSTTILEAEFQRCLKLSSITIENDSVLLKDGWKNTSNNSKLFVSMIHNTGKSKAFLVAWDLSSESETSEKLTDIVNDSVVLAKNLYNTHIYAVVSDNAAAMLKMGRDVDIWLSNCSSHTGNLLAKDVMNAELNKQVLSVLNEFKHANFEKALVDIGGSRIKTPIDTRWCTYRDSYDCFIKNVQHMKTLIVKDDRLKKN